MEFRVLGELEVLAGDRPLELGGAKQRSVLSMLVLQAGNVVSTDALIDGLWGERPPATAAKSLQVYVSRLRKALGENAIVTRPPGYLLDATPEQVDVGRFERLVEEAKREAPAASGSDAQGCAGALARLCSRRPCRRAVRASRDRATRGAPLGSPRGSHRGGSRPRQARVCRRGARGARSHSPVSRAADRTAHACALSLWAPGGGASGVPGRAEHSRRRAGARAGARAQRISSGASFRTIQRWQRRPTRSCLPQRIADDRSAAPSSSWERSRRRQPW